MDELPAAAVVPGARGPGAAELDEAVHLLDDLALQAEVTLLLHLKRQMCGRAVLDLLERRFLLAA